MQLKNKAAIANTKNPSVPKIFAIDSQVKDINKIVKSTLISAPPVLQEQS